MKLHFHAAETKDAQKAFDALTKIYGQAEAEEAEAIIALGGDGTLLETIHAHMDSKTPIYGMNRGSIGFLLNEYSEDKLVERIEAAHKVTLHPLRMKALCESGKSVEALAVNEVSLFRQSRQASKVSITIDGVERLGELMCDGVLVASPAGSTAYNFSAYGPIIPLTANVLALTAISAFRPRRWRGALLPQSATVRFDVHESDKRPVSATADYTEVRNVLQVDIHQSKSIDINLLFDPDSHLEERILMEQFAV